MARRPSKVPRNPWLAHATHPYHDTSLTRHGHEAAAHQLSSLSRFLLAHLSIEWMRITRCVPTQSFSGQVRGGSPRQVIP